MARESQDERDARLDRMSTNQRERLARESDNKQILSEYLAMLTYVNTNCECLYCCVGIQLLLEISDPISAKLDSQTCSGMYFMCIMYY